MKTLSSSPQSRHWKLLRLTARWFNQVPSEPAQSDSEGLRCRVFCLTIAIGTRQVGSRVGPKFDKWIKAYRNDDLIKRKKSVRAHKLPRAFVRWPLGPHTEAVRVAKGNRSRLSGRARRSQPRTPRSGGRARRRQPRTDHNLLCEAT